MIPRAALGHQGADQGLQIVKHLRRAAHVGCHLAEIPADVRRLEEEHLVGAVEAAGQLFFMHPELHGVGAGLQHRQDAGFTHLGAQAAEGGLDGGGVVGEVVIDADARHLALELHPPLGGLELAESGNAVLHHDTGMAGGGDGHQAVVDVVFADALPVHLPLLDAIQPHLEGGAVIGQLDRLPLGVVLTHQLHLAPAAHLAHGGEVVVGLGEQYPAIARHGAHQVVELTLDGGEIREDVRVVELQVVHHQGARVVVDELGALVEEGAVILVRFDDEEGGSAQTSGNREVARHATDEEAGLQLGVLQHPGQHAGGGGLAMGARNGQHPAILQHMLQQPLGAGDVGQIAIQHILHARVATAHGVADHHQVRRRIELGRVITLGQLYALLLELGAHGGIDVGIRAGDSIAQLFCQHRQTTHEGAADPENVNVHTAAFSSKGSAHSRVC
ncbi:hypothetical protein D3C76_888320 [compost metagenome]